MSLELSELTCEVELDMLEVLLCHGEHIAGVGKEYVAAVLVLRHVLVFALLEVLQLLLVVALHPAGFVQMYRFPAALGVILVLKTVLYDLELQLAHGAHDAAAVELVDEELCHTLVHKLLQTLLELLCLHGVVVLYVLEHLWRERRQSAEVQLLALGKGIANLEYAVVWQTYDVASPCLVDGLLALRHELRR